MYLKSILEVTPSRWIAFAFCILTTHTLIANTISHLASKAFSPSFNHFRLLVTRRSSIVNAPGDGKAARFSGPYSQLATESGRATSAERVPPEELQKGWIYGAVDQ
jgi:hypothetical protein